MIRNTAVLVFILSLILACKAKQVKQPVDNFELLKMMMTGSFDSSLQAEQDSAYYDITLHMYQIWTYSEGTWIYVEQSVSQNQSKPYRQRIYELDQLDENNFVSRVYTLEEPQRFISKWQNPEFFNQFDTSLLKEREGCEVYLKRVENGFAGSTYQNNCSSSLRGASYATSHVTIAPNLIASWDQGFNDNDEQVWGATKGAYNFLRIEP